MIHYGDITKISGYDVPIVDCIIGGSPCQDLSVAGKRAGLDGERSGLFMEQIRITKEMRDKDERVNGRSGEFIRPRFLVWENVPGAFSSNKGQDFRIVLEEIAKVVDKDAVIPMPPKDKWTTSGCIVGDGWSIAWRILDAQFWGVPQRRRRIALVADFGGGCAQEILFVSKGLRRDSEESGAKRKGSSADAQGCIGVHDRDGKSISFEPGIASREGGHIYEDVSGTLRANAGDNQMSVAYCYDIGDRRRIPNEYVDTSPTLLSQMGTGGNNVPVIVEGLDCYNQQMTGEKTNCLRSKSADTDHIPCAVIGCDIYNLSETGDIAASLTTATGQGASNTGPSVIVMDRSAYNQGENAKFNIGIDENGVAFSHIAKGPGAVYYVDTSHADDVVRTDDVVAPLQARDYKGGKYVFCLQGNGIDRADTAGCNGKGWKEGTCYTLNTVDRPAVVYRKPHYIVRRLTPLECERLQGFPDGWTDIGEYTDSNGKKKKTSDSARYKALGNSIALPPWKWVIKRLCSHYERDVTLASLFDGIGGFPNLWEQINGKGSAIWASEIEEFPIAVTKTRIE